jgi:hypothetical protein
MQLLYLLMMEINKAVLYKLRLLPFMLVAVCESELQNQILVKKRVTTY